MQTLNLDPVWQMYLCVFKSVSEREEQETQFKSTWLICKGRSDWTKSGCCSWGCSIRSSFTCGARVVQIDQLFIFYFSLNKTAVYLMIQYGIITVNLSFLNIPKLAGTWLDYIVWKAPEFFLTNSMSDWKRRTRNNISSEQMAQAGKSRSALHEVVGLILCQHQFLLLLRENTQLNKKVKVKKASYKICWKYKFSFSVFFFFWIGCVAKVRLGCGSDLMAII